MIVLWILLVVSFGFYHFTYFSYTSYIFNTNKFPIVSCVVCGLVNLSIWVLYLSFLNTSYEGLLVVVLLLMLLVETKIVFKPDIVHVIFIAVTYCINLFAKRLIFLSMSMIMSQGLLENVDSRYVTLIVAISTFTVSISTIRLARKVIPRISLDTILSDNKNITVLTMAYSVLYVTLFVYMLVLNLNISNNSLLYQNIFMGTFVILGFAVFILFSHSLAGLKVSTDTYKKIINQNTQEIIALKEMEKEAIVDDLTGLYTRDFADNIIDDYLKDNKSFYIAFIDLDGLKIVNDTVGHDEGDFYITMVCNTVKTYFADAYVSRYGGDEIVVVGDYTKEEDITIKIVQCYNTVLNIPNTYNKKYSTSISYGVAFRHSNETITAEQLMSIADARMYELKAKNNKHRKVIAVSR